MFARRHVVLDLVLVGAVGIGSVPAVSAQQRPLVLCQGTYSVSVTPDGSGVDWPQNTTGHKSVFTITNTSGQCSNSFSLTHSESGPISGVSLSKTNTGTLQPGASTTDTATYNVGAAGSGTLTLHAAGQYGGVSDDGSYSVTAYVPSVSVTPDGGTDTRPPNSGPFSETFTVQNTATAGQDTYTLTCTASGNITCGTVTPSSAPLSHGASTNVTVNFTTGGAGSGTLTLQASGLSTDTGYFTITVLAYGVTTTPDGDAVTRPPTSGPYSETFRVTNTGYPDSYTLTCTSSSNVSCGIVNPSSTSLGTGAWTDVIVNYSVGAPGPGTLTLHASGNVSDTGYFNVTVAASGTAPSNWDVTPFNQDNQAMGRCAAGCFAATYAHATAPYYSLGAPRSVALVYNGDRLYPKPLILLNVTKPVAGTPNYVWLKVFKNSVYQRFANGEDSLKFVAAGSGYQRIAAQLQDSTWATNMYDVTIVLTWDYGGGSFTTQSWATKLMVVNQTGSPIAHGWRIGGVQRLYPQDSSHALVVEGDGSAAFFRWTGSAFTSPNGDFSKLEQVYGGGWRRRYPDSTKVVFDGAGLMTDAYDQFNNRTQFFYDGSYRLYTVRDPNGQDLVLSYGSYLNSIRDNLTPARYTNVTVDGSWNLTAIQDPDGLSTTLQYSAGRLWTIRDRDTNTTTLKYAGNTGKLDTVIAPLIPVYGQGEVQPTTIYSPWQVVGLPAANQITGSNPVGVVLPDTVYGRITEPGGGVTKFTVDHWGQPVLTTNALNQTTTVTYEGRGLPVKVQYPSGGVDSTAYNGTGVPTYVQPAGVNPTNLAYNGTWVTEPDSLWQTGGVRQRFWLGAGGRVDSVEAGPAGSGTHIRHRYDTRGRDTLVTDPLGYPALRRQYQGTNGNLSAEIRPGSRTTTYGYDVYGRVITVAPPGLARDSIVYDAINRPVAVYDGVNAQPTSYRYDSLATWGGSFTRVKDAAGNVFVNYLNEVGWSGGREDPAGAWDNYQYNRDGDLVKWMNRRGQNIYFVYDALHRLVKRYGTNLQTDSLAYSTNNRVLTAISPVSTETTYLNLAGQRDSVKTHMGSWDYWLRYAYRATGLLDSLWASGSSPAFLSQQYGYHTQLGVLDSLRLGGALTRFDLDNALQPITQTLPGGDQVRRSFISLGGDMQISNTAGYNYALERRVSFDSLGRVWRHLQDPHPYQPAGDLYGYDRLGRLVADTLVHTGVDTTTCWLQDVNYGMYCSGNFWDSWSLTSASTYSYDPVGNRTDYGGTYGVGDRIQTFGGCSYTTDADGNVTSNSCGATYTWTADNRLASAGTTTLDYDAAGRLVRKVVNGSVMDYFLWNGDQLFADLGSDGNARSEYSYYPGMDRLHALAVGSTRYYAHQDGAGNVIALTGEDQRVKRLYDYTGLPWGGGGAGSDSVGFNSADRARWKGALWLGPEVNLYYLRNRWYDASAGRFLSEDPMGLEGGINPYLFAGDDPVNGSDPSGLTQDPCVDWYWVTIDAHTGEIQWGNYWKTTGSCGGGGGGVGLPRGWPGWPGGWVGALPGNQELPRGRSVRSQPPAARPGQRTGPSPAMACGRDVLRATVSTVQLGLTVAGAGWLGKAGGRTVRELTPMLLGTTRVGRTAAQLLSLNVALGTGVLDASAEGSTYGLGSAVWDVAVALFPIAAAIDWSINAGNTVMSCASALR